jgi:outer membrane biosynthesis protein TonB
VKEKVMKNFQLKCLLAIVASAVVVPAFAANETVFPKKSRTLAVKRPAECNQWVAPLPDKQARAEFPNEASSLKGEASLLVRIGSDGSYQGLVDFITTEDVFVRSAEKSLKEWTFTPAQCNGAAIASEARVDFTFRKEGSITFKTGSTSFTK